MLKKSKLTMILGGVLCGLSLALLLTAGLAVLQPATQAQARSTDIFCVGAGDKIQEAIDAADNGDIIRIEAGTFTENLVISKSLTLSGGWQVGCATQPLTIPTVIDANYTGRAVTIHNTPADAIVNLENLMIQQGDATGLGGATPVDPPSMDELQAWVDSVLITDTLETAPEKSSDWELELQTSWQLGLLPGDQAAYQALSQRIAGLLDQSDGPLHPPLQPLSNVPQTKMPNGEEVDCGGGVYVNGAALSLKHVKIYHSFASQSGPGYGGGLCALNMPAAGLSMAGDMYIHQNVASQTEGGIGGGVYVDGGDQAAVTFEILDDLKPMFWKNTASSEKRGLGGGLAIYNSPQVSISDTRFAWNLSGRYRDTTIEEGTSFGGGAYLQNCPNALLSGVVVINNMADGGGIMGIGGGMVIFDSEGIEISDATYFGRNTAHATLGLFGATGLGGGLALIESQKAEINNTTFEYNLASLYAQGYGGGLYSFGSHQLNLEENKFWDNAAAYFPNGNLYGGGASFIQTNSFTVRANEFKRNMVGLLNNADFFGLGPSGGGLGMDSSNKVLITENEFTENTGMVSGIGHGAGLMVGGESHQVEITHNSFNKNVSARNASQGGPETIGEGAGIMVDVASSVTIYHNTFENNAGTLAEYAGSVIMINGNDGSSLASTDIVIDANQLLNSGHDLAPDASFETGGIRVVYTEYITITNNVIAHSPGYGMFLEYVDSRENDQNAHAQIVNNTLVELEEFGLGFAENWSQDLLTVTNNIVVSSTVGMTSDSYNDVQVDHNLFYGNGQNLDGSLTEANSLYDNPLFVDAIHHDYQLHMHSPAREAGAGIPPAPTTDINGVTRPVGSGVDIGAYEYPYWLVYLDWILK